VAPQSPQTVSAQFRGSSARGVVAARVGTNVVLIKLFRFMHFPLIFQDRLFNDVCSSASRHTTTVTTVVWKSIWRNKRSSLSILSATSRLATVIHQSRFILSRSPAFSLRKKPLWIPLFDRVLQERPILQDNFVPEMDDGEFLQLGRLREYLQRAQPAGQRS
jgi:hypothetical protein